MRVQTHHPEVFLAGIITPGYNSKRIYNGLTNTKKSMRKIAENYVLKYLKLYIIK